MTAMAEETVEPYSVRTSGFVGQELIGPDGTVVAWTLDPVLAALIAKLLTESQEMFIQPQCTP